MCVKTNIFAPSASGLGVVRRAAMMLLVMMLTATTAWAQFLKLNLNSYVCVSIEGKGTVTLTHSGGTDVTVTSGTNYVVNGNYTLKFLPSGSNVVKRVTYKSPSNISAEDITQKLIDIEGGKSKSGQTGGFGTSEYHVIFAEPDATELYSLINSMSSSGTINFSVGGMTATSATVGQRVDITLSEPASNEYWAVSSQNVSSITQDDANHFHFTMPASDVTVWARLEAISSVVYQIIDKSIHGHVNWSGGNSSGLYNGGETATLTVAPDAGYEYVDGSLSAKKQTTDDVIALTDHGNGTWTFTMPVANVYVAATFKGLDYFVHFDANGGTGTMADQTFNIGEEEALTANAFTSQNTGYYFSGWNTKADGSGVSYTDGQVVRNIASAGETITLYAQWSNSYCVHFDKNNELASGSMTNQVFNVGEEKALTANAFQSALYSFSGWNTKADGSGTSYANGATVTDLAPAGQTITLYAQWGSGGTNPIVLKHTIISFDANGGTGMMANMEFVQNGSKRLPPCTFTRDGYSFKGWNTKADGTGTAYADGAEVSGNLTLYAQWTLTHDLYVNGDTYTINTPTGWGEFCNLLAENAKGFFTGKTVKLGNDIVVTSMAGSSQHDFTGTFDGNGKTLTVDYTTSEQYAAPFRNAENGCVIENLRVAGTINTSAQFAAGIIAYQFGTVTIRNCRSSVTINSSVSGDGTHGGFVGVKGGSDNSHLTIEGCVFDGKIVSSGASATSDCGGFVGWRNVKGSLTITNSLYAPQIDANAVSTGATFARNGGTISNCYYTQTLGDAQGVKTYAATSAPANIGAAVTGVSYTVLKAYENGVLYGGKYYVAPAVVTLHDDLTNDLSDINGYMADVTLDGRTLYKDGKWNTLCLPFSMSAEQIAANTDFAGATLMTMDVTKKNGFDTTDGMLWLSFKEAGAIEAGVPYLVKWTSGADITSPVFEGVTISSTAPQAVESSTEGLETVQMVGTYSPVSVTADDKSILFLGDANTLYYSTVDRQIRSCRAYFSVPYINGHAGAKARAFALSFDGEDTTGILEVSANSNEVKDDAWYSLDGVRLSGKPTQRGMYINKGKKIVVK